MLGEMLGEPWADEADMQDEGAIGCLDCPLRGQPWFASYRAYWDHLRGVRHVIIKPPVTYTTRVWGYYNNCCLRAYTPGYEYPLIGLVNIEIEDLTEERIDALKKDAEVWWMRVERHGFPPGEHYSD